MNKPSAAESFLKRLAPLLAAGRVVFRPRNWRKTWEFIYAEGMKEEDVLRIISHLKPEHYHEGPLSDRDGSTGEIMIFFYPYMQKTLYIKLKIWTDTHGDVGAVISFHEEGKHD